MLDDGQMNRILHAIGIAVSATAVAALATAPAGAAPAFELDDRFDSDLQIDRNPNGKHLPTDPRLAPLAKFPLIEAFWLVDADTEETIARLEDDMILDSSSLPANLTVVVETNDATASVELRGAQALSGVDIGPRIENERPFALNGDNDGDTASAGFRLGFGGVTATPYGAPNAQGLAGVTSSVTFQMRPGVLIVDTVDDAGAPDPDNGVCTSWPYEVIFETGELLPPRPGTCTLRAAIEVANFRPDHQTIILPDLGAPYELTEGELTITSDLTIRGEGLPLVDAGTRSRVMSVSDGAEVNIEGLTLTQGDAGSTGRGGVLHVDGSVVRLDSVYVSRGQANFGGGIYAQNGSRLEIVRSHINLNAAGYPDTFRGGGATNRGGGISLLASTAIIEDSEITRNVAVRGGGISAMSSSVALRNSDVTANQAAARGGGIEVMRAGGMGGGVLTIEGSSIRANRAGTAPRAYTEAERSGGGLFVEAGYAQLSDTDLSNNRDGWSAGDPHFAPDCDSRSGQHVWLGGKTQIGDERGGCDWQPYG